MSGGGSVPGSRVPRGIGEDDAVGFKGFPMDRRATIFSIPPWRSITAAFVASLPRFAVPSRDTHVPAHPCVRERGVDSRA